MVEIWKSAALQSECCSRGPSAVAIMIPCGPNVFRGTTSIQGKLDKVRCGTLARRLVAMCFLCEMALPLLKSIVFSCLTGPRICKNDFSAKYMGEKSVIYLLFYFCKAGDEAQSIKCARQASTLQLSLSLTQIG